MAVAFGFRHPVSPDLSCQTNLLALIQLGAPKIAAKNLANTLSFGNQMSPAFSISQIYCTGQFIGPGHISYIDDNSCKMKIRGIKTFYRGRLPHIVPIGAMFFVAFRLHDSISKKDLNELRQKFENQVLEIPINDKYWTAKKYKIRKEYIVKLDDLLDRIKNGPEFLKSPRIPKIVI